MARISGVDIPREKRLEISLTYIYRHRAHDLQADLHRAPTSTPTPGSAT